MMLVDPINNIQNCAVAMQTKQIIGKIMLQKSFDFQEKNKQFCP